MINIRKKDTEKNQEKSNNLKEDEPLPSYNVNIQRNAAGRFDRFWDWSSYNIASLVCLSYGIFDFVGFSKNNTKKI